MWILYIYLMNIGLILGSFFNVVGLRVPKHQSIITPRSACPNCQHTLTWKELIPVFSYIKQKGTCTNCSQSISLLYPAIEFLTGLLFALSLYVIGLDKELVVAITLISLLVIVTVSDLAYMIIPDKVLAFFLLLFIIERSIIQSDPWYDPLLGMLIGFGLLFLIGLISKGGMGGGDIKLFGVLGIALGLVNTLLTFFFAALIGSVVGMIGMGTGKMKRKKPIPFGPFIAFGALIAYFFGTDIFKWYVLSFIY
ncbi:leader peptidase (prepilin peptidase) / N-methyltransferase [Salinibacillus kushneri]|uniref:Leader peptidase (Prepilin peptidase) / N-methyltransferase n=2 Tax=Salinibacillus kushneri TaxID=237682 RepID=A0A1I0GMH6_9BACI|nr:leader peptidase (prepilin peptidase) / N-methyltransferase [Salinibacillus kushneri]